MKLALALALALAATLATPAARAANVTCEGTLEHGSAGEYIGAAPQCWLGSSAIEDAVLAVCKPFEHCKITGSADTCAKNRDRHMCLEITKLGSVSK